MTIACIDVGYTESESDPTTAIATCVVINDWSDNASESEHIVNLSNVRDYQPGQFYLRELPCIEAVMAVLPTQPSCIVIDGYVWLDDQDHPGLGKYLYDLVDQKIPVIEPSASPEPVTMPVELFFKEMQLLARRVPVGNTKLEQEDSLAKLRGEIHAKFDGVVLEYKVRIASVDWRNDVALMCK